MARLHRQGTPGDHPRVCGEHFSSLPTVAGMMGSSPRMRGARECAAALRGALGIIPAYAGSTLFLWHAVASREDHPRVCGEHFPRGGSGGAVSGSSPRMRGARRSCTAASRIGGIIPAYAGSTAIGFVHICVARDHPRVCGEHVEVEHVGSPSGGSSPHMRGALAPEARPYRVRGIIPAYAGSTLETS